MRILLLTVFLAAQLQAQNILRVWAVDDGERIKQTTLNHALRTSTDNAVWNDSTQTISLFGARNEFVAFQVIIEATSTAATNVNVKFDSLRNGSNFTIHNRDWNGQTYNYSGRHIEMFVMHYMNVHLRSSQPYIWWGSGRPGAPGDPVWTDADFTGYIGEQLVPFEATPGAKTNGQGGAPFSIAANRNQSVWVDVYIPKTAVAGDYTGTLKVTEGGIDRYTLNVALKVYDFTLSDTTHLKNTGYLELTSLSLKHPTVTSDRTSRAFNDMVKRYMHFGRRHRINVQRATQTPQEHWKWLKSAFTGTWFTPDSGYYGPGQGLSPEVFHIGVYDQPFRNGELDNGYWSGFGDAARTFAQIDADTTTWKTYWQTASKMWTDSFSVYAPLTYIAKYSPEEAGLRWDTIPFYDMRRKTRWLRLNADTLKYDFSMNFRPEAKGFGSNARLLWNGPGQAGFINQSYLAANPHPYGMILDSLSVFKALGFDVGLYGGTRPGFGTHMIDAPAIDMRVNPWLVWKYELWGYRFWHLNKQQGINPWYRSYRNSTWNDGCIIYSGQEESQYSGDSRGLQGPIAGVVMKNWRRGAQDYEYLWLADSLGLNVDSIVNSVVPKAFSAIGAWNGSSFAHNAPVPADGWKQRGYQYEKARRALADLITSVAPDTIPTGTITASTTSLPKCGGSVTIIWETNGATSITIQEQTGQLGAPLPPVSVADTGRTTYTISTTTTFVLTATNANGSLVRSVTVVVAPTGGQNIIVNSAFSSDSVATTDGWTLYSNGTGSAFSYKASQPYNETDYGFVEIGSVAGDNMQLYQTGVSVVSGGVYKVQFAVRSNNGNDLRIDLIKNTTPFQSYGLNGMVIPVSDTWAVIETTFTANTTASDGRFRFRFTTYGTAGTEYSIDEATITLLEAPCQPTLVSPTNAATVNTSLSFGWLPVEKADTYHFQLSTVSNFASLVSEDSTLTDASINVSGLSQTTTYYWRVQAKNGVGYSGYGTAYTFTTIGSVPDVPILATPADGATGQLTSVYFSWDENTEASGYHIQIATDSAFASIAWEDTVTDNNDYLGGFLYGTTYYWKVRAINAAGASSYATYRSFSTITAPYTIRRIGIGRR